MRVAAFCLALGCFGLAVGFAHYNLILPCMLLSLIGAVFSILTLE